MAKFISVQEHSEFANLSQDLKESITHFIHNFEKEGSEFIKPKRNAIKLKELAGITVNVKSFKIPHLFNQFAYKYIRKSKARRSFENAQILIEKGIGTPKPLAYFEYFSALGLQKSYYVSEHLTCDLTFRELINNPKYPDRENLLIATTDFTFNLHENNILFKDHSPGNTLIKKTATGYDFFLVDLNRMKFKTLTFEERIKNFSRLTPNRDMIEIMSNRYAMLINRIPKEVFELMWGFTEKFQLKHTRKNNLKRKLGLKK